MTGSPDRVDSSGDHSPPSSPDVRRGLEEVLVNLAPKGNQDYGLLPTLPFDAVMARAKSGEDLLCTPRLLELVVDHELSVIEARQAMDLVGSTAMESDQSLAVQHLLEAWWEQSLRRDIGEQAPGYLPAVTLGLVARWPGPMTRWLGPWIDQLDGPGARYLVDAVATMEIPPAPSTADLTPAWVLSKPLVVEAWRDLDDQRGQFLAWARTETVVNGLVLVGATHLDSDHYPELFSDVLDLLLEG